MNKQQERYLGKIKEVVIGNGGYQQAMFGVTFVLGGKNFDTIDFWGTWADRSSSAQFTEESWKNKHADTYLRLKDLFQQANVDLLEELEGKPIEVIFQNGILSSWRILDEVL